MDSLAGMIETGQRVGDALVEPLASGFQDSQRCVAGVGLSTCWTGILVEVMVVRRRRHSDYSSRIVCSTRFTCNGGHTAPREDPPFDVRHRSTVFIV